MPEHVEPSSADGAACSAPVPDGVRRQVPDVVPSDADVAACLRVLDALAARPAAFQSPAHRDLRAATRRARDALAQTDFGGGDGLAYGRRRQLRKEREARQKPAGGPGPEAPRRRRCAAGIERLRELTGGTDASRWRRRRSLAPRARRVARAREAGRELRSDAVRYSCKARFGNLHHFTCVALPDTGAPSSASSSGTWVQW
ncbi:short chain dehydrogenase [Aureococcus anophagefferens]|nr:short chain dehydrogenase [Aureococcus anophagefferens]